jgi:hypothetical protein
LVLKQYEDALSEDHVRPMDFTGRPMKGYVYVEPAGFKTDKNLRKWVQKGVKYVETLPPKKPKQLNLSKSQLIKAEPFVEFFIPPPIHPLT